MDRFTHVRDEDDPNENISNPVDSDGTIPDLISIADYTEGIRETRLRAELATGQFVQLWIRYSPDEINDALDDRMMEYAESGDVNALARIFCEVVEEWNLGGSLTGIVPERDDAGHLVFDDDNKAKVRKVELVPTGKRIPLDPEILQFLGSAKLMNIWKAVREDAMGVPTTRRDRRRQRALSRKR